MNLRDRHEAVEERIQRAVQRCGRKREDITLVAVTKLFPADVLVQAYELGMLDFGENYVQEFAAKLPHLSRLTEARFHLIGHLQSNKARTASDLFHVIQTVDSAKLARRLAAVGKPLEIMIEVKLSEEESKSGAPPEALSGIAGALREFPHLRLTGLMTMPPWSEDPERSRAYFSPLRELAEEHRLPHLSMGMSHDFEVAIEEGATHIRVGTALFGRRKKA
ncbi:MAG: YggS family pyridoxal phosphate-dependent enzyme [Bryobacteraceae bacterium]